jgi:hypothetical protein
MFFADVTKQKGAEPMIIKGQMLDYAKPEYRQIIKEKINEAENFFKHADHDHEATLDFNPDMADVLIIDACAQYRKLAGEEPPLFLIYRVCSLQITQMLSCSPMSSRRPSRPMPPLSFKWCVHNILVLCSRRPCALPRSVVPDKTNLK